MSTPIFESAPGGSRPAAELVGCGIDAEDSGRFLPGAAPWGWADVFSENELAHARRASDPARALCAAFCAKEALFKAVRLPFAPAECELQLNPSSQEQDVHLSAAIRQQSGISRVVASVMFAEGGECLVTVLVFGPGHEAGSVPGAAL